MLGERMLAEGHERANFAIVAAGEHAASPHHEPSSERVIGEALDRKLIVLSAGSYVNVSRIIPPLVTTADEVDRAISILDESLTAAGG